MLLQRTTVMRRFVHSRPHRRSLKVSRFWLVAPLLASWNLERNRDGQSTGQASQARLGPPAPPTPVPVPRADRTVDPATSHHFSSSNRSRSRSRSRRPLLLPQPATKPTTTTNHPQNPTRNPPNSPCSLADRTIRARFHPIPPARSPRRPAQAETPVSLIGVGGERRWGRG